MNFTDEEAAAYGPMLKRCSAVVKQVTGCDRVYMIGFGEGARHMHVHLAPRVGGDPDTPTWKLADYYRSVTSKERPPADEEAVLQVIAKAREAFGSSK